jgi:hypothetical protein
LVAPAIAVESALPTAVALALLDPPLLEIDTADAEAPHATDPLIIKAAIAKFILGFMTILLT